MACIGLVFKLVLPTLTISAISALNLATEGDSPKACFQRRLPAPFPFYSHLKADIFPLRSCDRCMVHPSRFSLARSVPLAGHRLRRYPQLRTSCYHDARGDWEQALVRIVGKFGAFGTYVWRHIVARSTLLTHVRWSKTKRFPLVPHVRSVTPNLCIECAKLSYNPHLDTSLG